VALQGAGVAALSHFRAGQAAVGRDAAAAYGTWVEPRAACAGDTLSQRHRARWALSGVAQRVARVLPARKHVITKQSAQVPLVVLDLPPHTTHLLTSMPSARHEDSALVFALKHRAVNGGSFSLGNV